MIIDLRLYRINHFSQNGEDGVIEKLFELLHIDTGWLVEFGAWDGVHLSNIQYHHTVNPHFQTFRIEGVPERFEEMTKLVPQVDGRHVLLNLYVKEEGTDSLNTLFEKYGVDNIALLSIDVDGPDLQLFRSLDTTKFRPAIVIIEEGQWTDPSVLDNLAMTFNQAGYMLVCCTGNFIFADMELLKKHRICPATDNIHTLLALSGNPEYDLHYGKINKEQFDAVVARFGEKDIHTKLGGHQKILVGAKE